MDKTWILIANGSTARLFATDKRHREYHLLEQFLHPTSRQKEDAITSDHSSHRETRTTGLAGDRVYGSFPEPTDPKDFEIDRFARDLAEYLERKRTDHSYEELVLVAPPKFRGLLNQHLDKNVVRMISQNIDKDYTSVPEHQLGETLESHLR